MNKFVTTTVAIVVIGLAFLAIQQRSRTRAAEERAAALERAARSAEAQARANEEAVLQKEKALRQTQMELDRSAVHIAKLGAATALTQPTKLSQSDAEGPFIKDPETRALMRKQQLQRIRKQVDRFVDTNLMARLALTSEQTAFLKELVTKKHSGHAEFMASLMAGELEGDSLRQTGRQVKEELLAAELEIKQFLGPERYEAFLDAEKAQEFRNGVKAVGDELKKSGREFSAEQSEQLLATMLDERRNFPFASGFGDPMTIDFENFHDHFSDANLDRYLNEVQAFNESVRQRAAAFLTPEQIEEMKSAQQNHLEQAKVTVKLTNALFARRRTN